MTFPVFIEAADNSGYAYAKVYYEFGILNSSWGLP